MNNTKNKITILFSNEKLTIENDEIHNSFGKYKDMQEILEYGPTWLDITDSYENESYSANENIIYRAYWQ